MHIKHKTRYEIYRVEKTVKLIIVTPLF